MIPSKVLQGPNFSRRWGPLPGPWSKTTEAKRSRIPLPHITFILISTVDSLESTPVVKMTGKIPHLVDSSSKLQQLVPAVLYSNRGLRQ